jgi:sialate O-acetylesterase
MKLKAVICSFLALIFAEALLAKVNLPAVFSSGMILQQKAIVNIWGKADREVAVTTSWDNKTYKTLPDKAGKWKVKINTPTGGGPYTIAFNDGEELSLSDVLIGEVWLASGQSNMEMPMKGRKNEPVAGSSEAIRDSGNSQIRFFNIKNISWRKPLEDCNGNWIKASPVTTPNFSAVAYFYAKILHEELNVPVGIIEADWGGTLVQSWMSSEALAAFSEAKVPEEADLKNSSKNTHSGLYNGMIHPVIGYGIRGAIWYQGEQNRHEPDLYLKMFPAMVKQWRKDWGIGDFPFYYVQIAPYISKTKELSKAALELQPYVPVLRESQLLAEKRIRNSGMAVLLDIGEKNTNHPSDKKTVAERLSYHALAKTYNMDGNAYASPSYNKIKVKSNIITLYFDNAEGGLILKNKESQNFEIAGKDRVFYTATAIIKGNAIILSSPSVSKPVAARYAFKAWAKGDLYNKAGLPASSFRTDKWSVGNSKSN